MLRRWPFARERDDVAKAIGRCGEVDVLVRREHRRKRHDGLAHRLPARFGQTVHPVGVLPRQRVCGADRRTRDAARVAEVQVALRKRPRRLGLALRRGVCTAVCVEVAERAAILDRDRGAPVDRRELLLCLVHHWLHLLRDDLLRQTRRELADRLGHARHRRVLAQRALKLETAGLVDDDLRTGHVLEIKRRLEGLCLVRVLVWNPAVPLVREMRPPERQVVLAVEPASKRRGKSEVAEREVLGARDFDARGYFVV